MTRSEAEVIVAGHICLDIIPTISEKKGGLDALFVPGKLVDIGPAVIATGGAVPNTGLALHRLGSDVQLMGKVGDDQFGAAIIEVLRQHGDNIVEGMIVAPGEHSSYTIVINPPNVDRIFLHCTGANDTFSSADLNVEQLDGVRLFHFGYPPLMRKMYEEQGEELKLLLSKARESGLTVSLDLAKPDPESAAGRADWRTILSKALPFVDVFLPSFEEIFYMLHRERYEEMLRKAPAGDILPFVDGTLLSDIAEELLAMGVAVVGLKLGEHGLYVRTTADSARLAASGLCTPVEEKLDSWTARELLAPCFKVDVIGTTGAGDCTIAGFLCGMLQGLSLEDALQIAVGVGACNVEQADATSGIPLLAKLQERITNGWAKREMKLDLPGWHATEDGLWSK
ncbi:carbohydrate kinase family protein [Paenibacillus psychroresistens]|uniref:Carbohydrate kinase family protein n=1 Tax=Paenibacillus psychroresistens TaxID=1778678 RepID=A0A6B8RF79_9BACL|nr:carbohydrate kinase family protein [Paenibacillus psychroresistens]QGQ94587.1 carbohydrate kinase family protein [Paenibacillus psychroresistens]